MTTMTSMTTMSLPLAAAVREKIASGRLDAFSEWWQMPLAAAVGAAILGLVLWLYRRDAMELPRGVGIVLAALRLAAFAAIAVAWLDLDRTTETELVFPSRVAILVDSSASMTLEDGRPADAVGQPPTASRSARSLELLEGGGLIESLRRVHDVSLWRFDADAEPLAVLPRIDAAEATQPDDPEGRVTEDDADWRSRVTARGFETRIGDALERVIQREPQKLLAGVVVVSDGASNAGVDPTAAAAIVAKTGVPIVPIGIGSATLPANVRVADVVAPSRVFPGDRFAVTSYLQSQGMAGQTVRVELSESASGGIVRSGAVIDSVDCRLAADGELASVRFDVPGIQSPGRRTLVVRVVAPANDTTRADDSQASEIEVVDRLTQVLLMAGGPGREYQFMRNVLVRDESFAVDVLLSTARKGSSQDARSILDAFPATPESLDQYDAIVAFDYDWRTLDPQQLGRLERWVGRESGGLVLVSGRVFMEAWLAEPACGPVRGLYPVELRNRGAVSANEEFGEEEPMPLSFTADGLDAEFLWLGSSRIASQSTWAEFPGVYGCFDATRSKPGATVYARAKRPGAGRPDDDPIFIAGQFYGSGTVVSLGSGELWRLRSIDDATFERVATQLVRHVSQGRLLRGSKRARLLVDRDRYPVGANVVVRVVLPEGARSGTAPPPACRAVGPQGETVNVPLAADPLRDDELSGSFVAGREGAWRIDLRETADGGETVTRSILAKLPDRELQRPKLDTAVLEQVAAVTGGRAFFPDAGGWNEDDSKSLMATLPDRSRREYQSGAADTAFKRRLNASLLAAAAGLLCVEWIVRRLARLA